MFYLDHQNLYKNTYIQTNWSPEENRLLAEKYEQTNGPWEEIQQSFPGKSIEELKTNWYSIHQPDTSKLSTQNRMPNWSVEEDNLLIEMVAKRFSWDSIAKRLPGRTSDACQTHYKRLSSKKGLVKKDGDYNKGDGKGDQPANYDNLENKELTAAIRNEFHIGENEILTLSADTIPRIQRVIEQFYANKPGYQQEKEQSDEQSIFPQSE